MNAFICSPLHGTVWWSILNGNLDRHQKEIPWIGLTYPLYQFEKKCWTLIKKNDPHFTITLRACWIALQERNGCNHVVNLFSGSRLTVAPGRTKKIILASISLDPVVWVKGTHGEVCLGHLLSMLFVSCVAELEISEKKPCEYVFWLCPLNMWRILPLEVVIG